MAEGARPASGFSLVEVMVATVVLGLLMGGMAQVFLAGLAGWEHVDRALAGRLALRRAWVRLEEDLQMLGCRFPPAEPGSSEAAWPAALRLVPGEPADDLRFLLDAPLPVGASLAAVGGPPEGSPGAGPAGPEPVAVRADAKAALAPGDLLLVLDGRLEWVAVRQPATLAAGAVATVSTDPFRFAHRAGAPLRLVRPRWLVRYTVRSLALETGHPERTPCLVRFEAPWPADGAEPDWDRLDPAQPGPSGRRETVAEGITGFRADFSLTGDFPGVRGRDAADTLGRLQAALQALESGTGVRGPRGHPGLLRVRLEAGAAGRHRAPPSLTCDLAPRNLGLEWPPGQGPAGVPP